MNVIITVLKDEDNFLVDFIIHHVAIGFDRIVLFDDLSVNPVSDVVASLPRHLSSKVECHRLATDFNLWQQTPDLNYMDEELYKKYHHSKQMYLLNFAIRYVQPSDWIAVTDVDEFLWLGSFSSIGEYRSAILDRGFSAAILTMLMYGHSYHLVPPTDNNICSFLWRSCNYFAHGKFFAQVGALTEIKTPHFCFMRSPGMVCDLAFRPCDQEFDWDRPALDPSYPHLKHYTVQDVYSCFRRRVRIPVSQKEPMLPTDDAWLSRIDILKWSSAEIDTDMALSIIASRAKAKLSVASHVRALSNSLDRVEEVSNWGAVIDFDFLRDSLGYPATMSDGEALHNFVSQDAPDTSVLRFAVPPLDFNPEMYRSLHGDLCHLSARDLMHHYLNYGKKEGRAYRLR